MENENFIIQRVSGERWNFYINDSTIYYNVKNNDSTKLIENIKKYDVSLDKQDNIHLICITYGGEFIYYIYSHNKWRKNILEKFNPKLNSIDFLNIIIAEKIIHVIYTFRNVLDKNLLKINHFFNCKNKWEINNLETISLQDKYPYFIDYHANGDVFLLYKTKIGKKVELYLRRFSCALKTWEDPTKMQLDKDIYIVNCYIDYNSHMHLVYKTDNNDLYHSLNNIKYLPYQNKLNGRMFFRSDKDVEVRIFEINHKICIVLKDTKLLHCKYSSDYGENWIEVEPFEYKLINNIYHVGHKYGNSDILKNIKSFGNAKENKIYFIDIKESKGEHASLEESELFRSYKDEDKEIELEKNEVDKIKEKNIIEKIKNYLKYK